MSVDTFFALLQAGIWGQEAKVTDIPQNWPEIYNIAQQQSVLGVVFDGINTLPKSKMPKHDILFNWYANVCNIESCNKLVNRDVASLTAYFDKNNIAYRLMKGQGCASFYPNPLHRQSGDIDIFVGEEQYERAKETIRQKDTTIEKESLYDAHFAWGDTMVEMHRMETMFYSQRLNKHLQSICRKEEWIESVSITVADKQVMLFNPTFNVYYTFVHLYHHFLQLGVGLRQLCDLALMLKTFEKEIDWVKLQHYLEEIGALRAWNTFYGLATEHMGLKLEHVPYWMTNYSNKDVQCILADILTVGNFGKHGKSLKKRSFNGGLTANIGSFWALLQRLFFISKFGKREAFAYPIWKLRYDHSIVKRYKKTTHTS